MSTIKERLRASPTSDLTLEAAGELDARQEKLVDALEKAVQIQRAARAIEAERDALREALRWAAATLQDATSSLELVFDEDQITIDGETKTVEQILDAADAALAQEQS